MRAFGTTTQRPSSRSRRPPSRDQRWGATPGSDPSCEAARKAGRGFAGARCPARISAVSARGANGSLRLSRSAIQGWHRLHPPEQDWGAGGRSDRRRNFRRRLRLRPTDSTWSGDQRGDWAALQGRLLPPMNLPACAKLAGLPAELRFSDLRRSALTEAGRGRRDRFRAAGRQRSQDVVAVGEPASGQPPRWPVAR